MALRRLPLDPSLVDLVKFIVEKGFVIARHLPIGP